jgi:hypothetical protein
MFYHNKRMKDGLTIYCKECTRAKLAVAQKRPPQFQAPAGMKRCTLCKEIKPDAEFANNKNFHDGLNRSCRACNNARGSAYGKANRKRLSAEQLQRYHANPERYADYDLKKRFGLPMGSYDRMLKAQDGKCAICKADKPGGRAKRFHVDHCHATGRVRALLCEGCNNGLGRFRDKPDLLRAAANY